MSSTRAVRPQAVSTETPPVPLTIEGYSVLHQMMRVRWPAWRELSAAEKSEIVNEAITALADGTERVRAIGIVFAAGTQGRFDACALPAVF